LDSLTHNYAEKGLLERTLVNRGLTLAGVDEVGRGCLAGPVVAACVILDYKKLFALDHSNLSKIRDSKTLSSKQRAELIDQIVAISLDTGIGIADPREIEINGILNATFLAMNRAVAEIKKITPDILLVDGNQKIK